MEYKTTVYLGIIDGKKIRKTVRATSQRELDRKVRKLKSEVDAGKDCYTKATFGIWADKWYNEVKVPKGLAPKTLDEISSCINHLKGYFEDDEFKDITLSRFQQFINDLAKQNPNTLSPSSKRLLKALKETAENVFAYASANNIAAVPNYFKFVVIPQNAPEKKRRALSEEEQQWIIDTPHRAQLPAMLMMFAGLRRGELIPLEWKDIDLGAKTISVNKSVQYGANNAFVKEGGKTKNARRIIPIPPILSEYLSEYLKNNKPCSKYVCPSSSGKIYTYSGWRSLWNSYLDDLNIKYGWNGKRDKYDPHGVPMLIPNLTPHYLRHTYATILYLQGVDAVTAKQYLGHADIQTTINIYTDLENFSRFALSEDYKKKLSADFNVKV